MMLKMRIVCLLVVLSFLVTGLSANADSLRQVWTNVNQPDSVRFNAIEEYYTDNIYSLPDSVVLLSVYHEDLAEQKNSREEQTSALEYRAKAHLLMGDYDHALVEMNKSIDISLTLNDSIGLAHKYNNLALIHSNRLEYQEAIEYYSKCLTFYQANNLKHPQAAVLVNLGLIQLEINNYDFALENWQKALVIFETLQNEREIPVENEIGITWLNMGMANLGKRNYHQAIEDIRKALKIFESYNQQFYIATSYTSYARVYKALNQIDTSLFYLNKSIEIHKAIGNNLMLLKDQVLLAHLILPTDLNRATGIGEEILYKSTDIRDHTMKIELYDLLYQCYKKKENFPRAVAMLEKHNAYSDSLRIQQDQVGVTEKSIQTLYETKILNERLRNEQAHSQLKLSQTHRSYFLAFLGSTIMLCIIFYARARRIVLNKEKEVLRSKVISLKKIEDSRKVLIQTDKMASLGQLTAGVAHEINNPINFISSGVIGLKSALNQYIKDPSDKASNELVGDMNDMIIAIEEGAKRTSDIVRSLQLFSREGSESYMEADIIAGLESTCRLLSNKLNHGVTLSKVYSKSSINIFCYPGQLNQVFMNIILNAIQAVEGSGDIKITVTEENDDVRIVISDNGPGIPDNKKQKIFEPFYTTKDVQEGTGLGLSITFGIIKKHNGSIEVVDNEPSGTQFIISLPKRVESLLNH